MQWFMQDFFEIIYIKFIRIYCSIFVHRTNANIVTQEGILFFYENILYELGNYLLVYLF